MANTVFKLRRSSVAGKQPNTSTLAIGELALNLTDRKLYSSDGTNVWETGANLTTLTVSTNTTVNNIIITGGLFANGGDGAEGQVLTSNGTSVYWSSVSGGSASAQVRQQFVGDDTTTSFTITDGYESNTLSVFLNGVLLRNGSEANVQSGSVVVISPAPANGSLIDVVGVSTIYPSVSIFVSNSISVGNSSVNTQITPGNVFLNGSTLVIGNTSSNVTINSTSLSIGVLSINSSGVSGNLAISGALIANNTAGVAGQALYTNGSATYWANVTAIAGTNTQIQFNDSGFANGSSSLIFNKDTSSLQVSNVSSANILQATGGTESTKPTGANGMIRYNSNSGFIEAYTPTGWASFAISSIDYGTITDSVQTSLDFGSVP